MYCTSFLFVAMRSQTQNKKLLNKRTRQGRSIASFTVATNEDSRSILIHGQRIAYWELKISHLYVFGHILYIFVRCLCFTNSNFYGYFDNKRNKRRQVKIIAQFTLILSWITPDNFTSNLLRVVAHLVLLQ